MYGVVAAFCILFSVLYEPGSADNSHDSEFTGTSVYNERGFLMRDFHLGGVHTGSSMWTFGHNAMLINDKVQLTADVPNQSGLVWSNKRVTFREWEIVVDAIIYSSGTPADGIAVWYSKEIGSTGVAYGSSAVFSGIGVVLDTYKNQIGRDRYSFPRLSVIFNNGSRSFDPNDDGSELFLTPNFPGCDVRSAVLTKRPLRSDKRSLKILVRYVNDTLHVYFANYDQDSWIHCKSYTGLRLPLNYHIGVSAATGDLSSQHEISSLKMYKLEATGKILDLVSFPSFDNIQHNTPQSSTQEGDSWIWVLVRHIFIAMLSALLLFGIYYVLQECLGEGLQRRKKFY